MASDRSRVQKCADIILIGLFMAAIALPLIGWLMTEDTQVSDENRVLEPLPRLQAKADILKRFPGLFEAYFNDHFGFRPLLIRTLSLGRYLLGVSTSPQVVIGPSGWLYYSNEPVGRDYGSTCRFTFEELTELQQRLETQQAWCAARGMRYLFVVAPDKQTIYPEELPAPLRQRRVPSRFDQLLDHLAAAQSPVTVLDLRPALWQAKQEVQIYSDMDTHWNDAGAFVAYQQIMAALANGRPELQPLPRSAFEEKIIPQPFSDLRRMLYLENVLTDYFLQLVPHVTRRSWRVPVRFPVRNYQPECVRPFARQHPNAALPRAVVFRDSFATILVPFVSEHFRRSVYIWQNQFDPVIVEREQPDIVIHEIVERNLHRIVEPPPPTDADLVGQLTDRKK